jgi:hypothetical protein
VYGAGRGHGETLAAGAELADAGELLVGERIGFGAIVADL